MTRGSAWYIAGVLYLWTYIVIVVIIIAAAAVVVVCMSLLLNTRLSVEHMYVWCPQGPQEVKAAM